MQFVKKLKISAAASLLALATLCPPLAAQDSTTESSAFDGHLSLGLAFIAAPEFEGSDKTDFHVVPVIEYHSDRFFISGESGLGVKFQQEALTFVPALKFRFGRDEDDSKLLKGMGDVDWGLEAGAFAEYQLDDQLKAKLEIMQGLGDAEGLTAALGLSHMITLDQSTSLMLGVGTMYADSHYNKQYFGVTRKQSRNSGYEQYSPGGGFKHVDATAAVSRELTEQFSLSLFGQYKRLTGPAADSPIVKRGSKNQLASGVSLTWTP